MIDAGLPSGRDGWPRDVLERLKRFAQGDVIPAPPIFYWADPAVAVWDSTREAGIDQADVVLVEGLVHQVIITSQTCDIAEEDTMYPSKPFVSVAPIYEAASRSDRNLLERGRGPAYLLYLPELAGGFFVADFRLELPIEKGWLSRQSIVSAFPDENAQQEVGRRLTRIRERPAFSRQFLDHIVMPLVEALRSLRQTDRVLFNRITDSVAQVRALVDSRLHTSTAQLLVVGDERIPGDVTEWFRLWWDEVNPRAHAGGVTLQAIRILTWDEMTASEYRTSGEVNLTRWSPD